jgi:hypothetical protein
LKPITGTFHDWFNLGLTIVDALDTIYIMGLKEGKAINSIQFISVCPTRKGVMTHRI